MNGSILLLTAFFCILPISELRGGLPYALANGVPLIPSYLFCVLINLLVAPLVILFLNTLHRLLWRIRVYRNLFDRIVARTRKKIEAKVEKYGYWGLAFFVGIPLPITGAYTGALGAWVLGMNPRRSILAISVGVLTAGVVVAGVYYLVTQLGVEALKIFIKETG
jgi:uncharacterized membrane protein